MAYSKDHVEKYTKKLTKGRIISGHGHSKRVYETAKKLSKTYDDEVLHAAAFLHDIELAEDHHLESSKHARNFLKHRLPKHKLHAISHAIEHHVLDGDPKSVEAIILHDADLLDHLGMIGLIRLTLMAREWHGKENAKDVLKTVRTFRKLVADKIILKQSKAKAADKLMVMDMAINELEKEIS